MSPLILRELADHDLDALLGLYAELHPADAPLPARSEVEAIWQQMRATSGLQLLGGFVDEALVVSCTLVITPNLTRGGRPYALIENVVTTASQRRKGYAKALLEHAKALAWQARCYKVMLMTSRQDVATRAFYESAGFDAHTKQAYYAAAPTQHDLNPSFPPARK
ncbi:GNAT family N-acetyltransferase [Uliginosibacterium aquaticum]|uniref:GNAT family N-acetyltransferase n=1 Tax=Uliginosibacterium aquaticum TaxID=2731212 RepID=A0ABX2IPI8_9RHOO|nr:GNAT family N-acetyltransferase [Uliginosibacterium aquaticum]NSL56040.1 GNAT family N-acetyltransferase [Uliginosibacterium aquaticum]